MYRCHGKAFDLMFSICISPPTNKAQDLIQKVQGMCPSDVFPKVTKYSLHL